MSVEQLIFIAVFVLVALFNLIRQARRQRRPEGETADGPPPVEEERAPPPRRVVIAPPVPRPAGAPQVRFTGREYRPAAVARPAPARAARRGPGRRLFSHRGDARRGIVLITVLGPCRGLESPSAATGDIYTTTLPR
jgi:hypothetical protein